MLFTKPISSVLTTVIFGALLAQAQDVKAGRYRIFNGEKSARSFPIEQPQTEAPMILNVTINPFRDFFGQWDINGPDGNGAYLIRNAGSGAGAYADQTLDAEVRAVLGNPTSWLIENKGSGIPGEVGSYVIKIPFQDFVWTSTPRDHGDDIITLKKSDGSGEQRFVLDPVRER